MLVDFETTEHQDKKKVKYQDAYQCRQEENVAELDY